MTPYWEGDGITLYLGDNRDITTWLTADVLITDPPYGLNAHISSGPEGRRAAGHTRVHSRGAHPITYRQAGRIIAARRTPPTIPPTVSNLTP